MSYRGYPASLSEHPERIMSHYSGLTTVVGVPQGIYLYGSTRSRTSGGHGPGEHVHPSSRDDVVPAQHTEGPLLPRHPQPGRPQETARRSAAPVGRRRCGRTICDQVSKTGGHLAPNLGVVEQTIALHYVFDFSNDRLLFDVGHQCYPHKLLTGRLGLLSKLRQREGMSGFPEPRESPYDLFSVGHAGTAISTAVGMARGDQRSTVRRQPPVSVASSPRCRRRASIVNGVALEGLNNAGTLKRQFLVVLNDNGMSIAKPQGAIAQYFDRVRVNAVLRRLQRKGPRSPHARLPRRAHALEGIYHSAGEILKHALVTDHMFEHFGLICIGPMDGHDLPTMIDMLNEVKDVQQPILLHVKTVKGKGFDFTSGDPSKFHSPSPFVVEGCRVEMKKSGRSFTTAYADAMVDMMKKDKKVYAVTAAMPDGTGLNKVIPMFPERSLDTGICESHAMDMCAGLAKTGIKPFFAVYSTFVQRAMDQVFQEITLQGLPVRICLDRAGFVGDDGAVHHGFMDITPTFKALPGRGDAGVQRRAEPQGRARVHAAIRRRLLDHPLPA